MIEFLRRETLDFIGPEVWPADSPDLNPVDYRIWGLMQEHDYQSPIQDVDDLKQRLISVWAELKQSVIDKAIDQRRRGGQGWGHAFMPEDSTLNNWLIEIPVCLLNVFVFTRTFFVRTSNLKANIHNIPFQLVKNSYFKFLQGSVATLFRWSWKILSYFVANLSKTLHTNFYQNRSSIVEVMIKKFWCVFLCPTVYMSWFSEKFLAEIIVLYDSFQICEVCIKINKNNCQNNTVTFSY